MKNKKRSTGKDKFTTMDMPEVKDIPGQEHVRPPRMREMEDTTISSAGEEGEGIVDDLNKEDNDELMDDTSNVSKEERKLLSRTGQPTEDADTALHRKARPDRTDGEDALNEQNSSADMGEDLDVPGSELDDEEEELGEEDEENNSYSRSDN